MPFLMKVLDKKDSSDLDIVATTCEDIRDIPAKLVITSHRVLARALGRSAKSSMASAFSYKGKRGHAYLRVQSVNIEDLTTYQQFGHHIDRYGRVIPFSGIVVGELDGRHFVSLPWDMSRFPSHWSRWSIYVTRVRDNERLFCETAPRIDDRIVREAVFDGLAMGYDSIKVPLVRVSPRIVGPGYIIVRIDADGYSKTSTERIQDLALRAGVQFSWFIDTWSWRKESVAIRQLSQSNEVGLHSYFHATSIWTISNLRNLRKGFEFLNSLQIQKIGFVSPFGHWNDGLSRAISMEKVRYSSEFALSCDVIPLESGLQEQSTTLQIPTIPISLGVWTGRANYWEVLGDEITQRIEESGFAVLYDHPLNRLEHHTDELSRLIKSMSQRGHVFVTLDELSKVFASRPRITYAEWHKGKLSVRTNVKSNNHFRVETIWGGECRPASNKTQLNQGIGRMNSFSLAWGRTIFFGVFSTIPISWHIFWARIRSWLRILFRGAQHRAFAKLNRN